jgi:hypothetical protein
MVFHRKPWLNEKEIGGWWKISMVYVTLLIWLKRDTRLKLMLW